MLKAINHLLTDDKAIINYLKTVSNLNVLDTIHYQLETFCQKTASDNLERFDIKKYAKTRNYEEGTTSHLSPYISTGLISSASVYDYIKQHFSFSTSEKFIQELAWREFWNHVIDCNQSLLWKNAEPYKTGFNENEYTPEIPDDILNASTPSACINEFIQKLYATGKIHNHIRMYLASYLVHWRRVKWQAGAEWFSQHLLDEHPPSNCLSWQWVASTFSQKPYIFNLENIRKFVSSTYNTRIQDNQEIHGSYDLLKSKLFPNLKRS